MKPSFLAQPENGKLSNESLKLSFGYQSRVGKDTVCNYLKEKYGGTILHFSDPLYKIMYYAQDCCGFENVKDPSFLQYIGTWARNKDPQVWVNMLEEKLLNTTNVYVADVRFK